MLFTRKQVNVKQIKTLIADGFLPVSCDYRLCPEVNILDGPMNDVCEALRWARFQLPSLASSIAPGLQVDGKKVVAVGWSTGGQLAMTLGFTAPQRGFRAPEAILAFYCPTDYEDDCKRSLPTSFWNILPPTRILTSRLVWKSPIQYPEATAPPPSEPSNLLKGIQKEPVRISPLSLLHKNYPLHLNFIQSPPTHVPN